MKVMAIEDYNTMQEAKYRKAIDDYKFGKDVFPYYPKYFFYAENAGSRRTTGFVAISDNGRGHFYGETERKAINKLRGLK